MLKFSLILVFILLAAMSTEAAGKNNLSVLRKAVFLGYDKLVSPDDQVSLEFGITIIDLGYCPHKQVFTVRSWVAQSWTDPRLTWDPQDFNGVDELRIPSSQVWIPDVALYNRYEKETTSVVQSGDDTKVILKSDGSLIFVPAATFRVKCNANEEGLPWSAQNCSLNFGSWTMKKEQLDIQANGIKDEEGNVRLEPLNLKYFSNSRVEIINSAVSRLEPTYPCCPGEIYPLIKIDLDFKTTAMYSNGKILREGDKEEDSSEEGGMDM